MNDETLTVGDIRKLIDGVPDEAIIGFPDYYKGARISGYKKSKAWRFPNRELPSETKAIVITKHEPNPKTI